MYLPPCHVVGYVLSRSALRTVVEQGFYMSNIHPCQSNPKAEDEMLGKCLAAVNVSVTDSRDDLGKHRFHPFPPDLAVKTRAGRREYGYWNHLKYPFHPGADCCSRDAISFHRISPEELYHMDALIHHEESSQGNDDNVVTLKKYSNAEEYLKGILF